MLMSCLKYIESLYIKVIHVCVTHIDTLYIYIKLSHLYVSS